MLESIALNQRSGRLERVAIPREAHAALAIVTLYGRAMARQDGSSVDPAALELLRNDHTRLNIVKYFCEMSERTHPTQLLLYIVSDIARDNGRRTTREHLDSLALAIDHDRAARRTLRKAEEDLLATQDSLSPSMLSALSRTIEAVEIEANKAFLRSLSAMMTILSQ